MSRVDELRDGERRPSDPALAIHSSTASARDVSPAPSNRQLLHGAAYAEDAVAVDTTAPISPRLSHARALRSPSDAPDPNLVEFGVRDPDNPLHFSMRKKMLIFAIVLSHQLVAVSLGTIYAPAASSVAEAFGVGSLVSRLPLATYLLAFSVGPVFLTPAAEDYGRKPVYIVCMTITYLLQIPCALAPSFASLVVCRFLAGFFFSPVFNAVGCLPDLFDSRDPQSSWLLNWWAFVAETATIGSLLGAWIVITIGWRWVFGVCGIVGGALLVPYILFVPETRAGPILARRARHLRKTTGNADLYAAHEAFGRRSMREVVDETLLRPLQMLFREPIVYVLAIWDGLNYGIIYLAIEAVLLVYGQYGFNSITSNVALQSLIVGYLVGIATFPLATRASARIEKERGEGCPEAKLWWAKPPVPWIISVIGFGLFGASSHILFIVISDYTVLSYGHYAGSAVTGQSFAREIMAASLALVGETFYQNVGTVGPPFLYPTLIIAIISTPMALIPFAFDRYGPAIRARSHFALAIRAARDADAAKEKRDFSNEKRQATNAVDEAPSVTT